MVRVRNVRRLLAGAVVTALALFPLFAAGGPAGAVNNPTLTTLTVPLLSLTLSTGTQTLGDEAFLMNASTSPPATGTITFTLTGPGGPSVLYTDHVTIAGNGSYSTSQGDNPGGFTLPTTGTVTGTYQWHATYSGDANNSGASDQGGFNEQVQVTSASPQLSTTASPTSVTLQATSPTFKDSATLSKGYFPTGTLTFELSAPGGGAPVDTEMVPVNGNGTYTTPTGFTLPTTGNLTGNWRWFVGYTSDNANNGNAFSDINDPNEETTVSRALPTLTTASNPGSLTLSASPPMLNDSATISGAYFPTGTITFELFEPGGGVFTEQAQVNGNGTYSTPTGLPLQAPSATGTYQWDATYSGDANNLSASTHLGDEPVTVSQATPTLSTAPSSGSVIDGATINDSATLAGGFNPTGTIIFTLFNPSSAATYTDMVTVNGNGTYSTAMGNDPGGFPTNATGTWQWQATYSSADSNNAGASTNLGDEPVVVHAPTDLSIAKNGPSSVVPGSNFVYTVTVTNLGPNPADSATMDDQLPAGMTVVSAAAPSGWTCTTPTTTHVTCSTTAPFGVSPPTAIFAIVAHVSAAVNGTVSNVATIASPNDNTPANDISAPVNTAVHCDQTQGSAVGTVRLGPGSTCITGANITGNLVVPAGATVVLLDSTIGGNLTAPSPGSVTVCNTTFSGSVRITGASGFVLLGDPLDDGCAPNNIHGSVKLMSNHHGVELVWNQIGGSTSVRNTTGNGPLAEDVGAELEGNTIGGALSCVGNVAPSPTNGGQLNTVTGKRTGQCVNL